MPAGEPFMAANCCWCACACGCAGVAGNDTIYQQMWGPTEFKSTGSLKTWTRAADMDDVLQPSLFIAGEFDEARPGTLEEFRRTMRNAQLVVIPGAGHGAAETPYGSMKRLGFLRRHLLGDG
jgi:pimeloyl-ACP methyl ester carboxylesterase